jgi:branched-subunit amino acid transport protein
MALPTKYQRWGRFCQWTFLLLFALFVLNILVGKAEITFEWKAPFLLSDVAEYLLLMATALFFILGALAREAHLAAVAEEAPPNPAN